MSKDITDLLNERKEFRPISYRPPPEEIPAAPLKYQPSSREHLCDKILKLFENPNVKIVGCYGMGGIGKTTLGKEVKRLGESWKLKGRDGTAQLDNMKRYRTNDLLHRARIQVDATEVTKDAKLFEKILRVEVSNSPVITTIQRDIAESLGLILTESSESARASRLHASLKEMKILIILDDIWQVLDLHHVGIPCGDGVVSQKVLLISRNLGLLKEMNSVKNFEVPLLEPPEAAELFKSSVKVEDENLAKQILQKCGGHPLAITVVAGIVRGRERSVWIETLKQLARFENRKMYRKVYSVIEFSFSFIEEEQKDLLMLCSILGENAIPIINLLMYGMGLRLFKHRGTLEDAWNRLKTLLLDLQSSSLLLGFDETHQCVSMHEMVRDAACNALQQGKTFLEKSCTKLEKLPTIKSATTRISLPDIEIDELPPILKFPDLEFFLYHAKSSSIQLSHSLFCNSKKLRVISLSGIQSGLPSSLRKLENFKLCVYINSVLEVQPSQRLKGSRI